MLAQDFADHTYQTNLEAYARRKQTNQAKILQDIYLGKAAELAAYRYFADRGYSLDLPDLKTYEPKDKSFAPDLVVNGSDLHVKSFDHTSVLRSWVFQAKDEPKGYFALCETQLPWVFIHAVLPAEAFREDWMPTLYNFPSKKCLYAWCLRDKGNLFDLSGLGVKA